MKNKFLNLAIIFSSIFALASCGSAGTYADYTNSIKGHVLTTLVPEDNTETPEDESTVLLDSSHEYKFKTTQYDKQVKLPIYTEDGIFERIEDTTADVVTTVQAKDKDGFQIVEEAYRENATKPITITDTRWDVESLGKTEKENYYTCMVDTGNENILPHLNNKDDEKILSYDKYKVNSETGKITDESNNICETDENGYLLNSSGERILISKSNFIKHYDVFKTDKYNFIPESKKWKHFPLDSYAFFNNIDKTKANSEYRNIHGEYVEDLENSINPLSISMHDQFLWKFENGFMGLSKLLNIFKDANLLNDASTETKPTFIELSRSFIGNGWLKYLTTFETDTTYQVKLDYTSISGFDDFLGNFISGNVLYISNAEIKSAPSAGSKDLFKLEVDTSVTKNFSIDAPAEEDIIEGTLPLPEETK